MKRAQTGYIVLGALAFIAIILIFSRPPISQAAEYHDFCDSKTLFGIPNFWNVVSNLPFLILGVVGFYKTLKASNNKNQYFFFFIGIALVSLGSGYYHLNPNDATLVWDRLPMTIVFMSLFSIMLSEFLNDKLGRKLLFPLMLIGLFSMVYWRYFDDLRLYVLIQFYPILAMLILLLFFKSRYTLSYGYWLLFAAYVVAKLFEHFDHQTFEAFNLLSGHTLKHFAVAVGVLGFMFTLDKKEKINV